MKKTEISTQGAKRRVSERFTYAQSEKSVIDLLEMSISCIFFLRGFFNDSYFKEEKFFIDKHESLKNKKDYIRIKKLKPEMSPESDTIINWIKVSITDALKKKYLSAIDLSISLDGEEPSNVTEAYIFKVNYEDASGGSISLNNDVVLSPTELTRMNIFKLMKKLILLTQSLAPLPVQRYLFMRLLFNNNCPKDYNPEHFVDYTKGKASCIKIPLSAFSDLKTTCGQVNSVHHTVSMDFISLSSLEINDYKNTEILEMDPFDIFNEEKQIEEKDLESNNINAQVSQVTKDLYDMLKNYNNEIHDGETQVMDSLQTENAINCTCGSSRYLSYSSIVRCSSCFNNMHKVCYAVTENNADPFTCYNCSKNNTVPLNDMCILFSIRKLLSYFQERTKNTIKSITDAASIIGFNNVSQLPAVVDALSVLIFEGILSLKQQKSFNHNVFNVDVQGLLIDNNPTKIGKYFLSIITKNKKEKIEQFLNPSFGKFHEIINSTIAGDENFNETTIVDEEDHNFEYDLSATERYKKRKISKSIDILNI